MMGMIYAPVCQPPTHATQGDRSRSMSTNGWMSGGREKRGALCRKDLI